MQDEPSMNEYQVTKVQKTTPPEGMPDDNWYRYVIKRGEQVIEGKKKGSLKAVKEHAASVAELINSRHFRSGRKSK